MTQIELLAPKSMGERSWGSELLIAHTPQYLGKLLYMKRGRAGGLQYHVDKDETFYLFEGEAWVETDTGDGKLTRYLMTPGMSVHVPPGAVHRVIAIENCTFFEASTPHFEDRVHVEARYGQVETGGLPTTR